MESQNSFKVKVITFPKIESLFLKTPEGSGEFEQAFKAIAHVMSDTTLKLLFGIRMTSRERTAESKPSVLITVEAVAEIELKEPLAKVEKLADVPLAANMLAILYPFIREKIAYIFGSNNAVFYLPPVNTIDLLARHGNEAKSFTLKDFRQQPEPSQAAVGS